MFSLNFRKTGWLARYLIFRASTPFTGPEPYLEFTGEDFGEETSNALKEIKDRGVKLFALGVGTAKGSRIETRNGYLKDRSGNEVITKLENKGLKKLAARTGGKYFEINDRVNDTERLINTINQVEGELRDARVVDVSANKYIYFLLAAFILLLIDVLTTVKTIKI